MRSITWVTADYFVDCDFNREILERVLQDFEIHWIILLPYKNARFKPSDFDALKHLKGLNIKFMRARYRQRDLRSFVYYHRLYRKIKELRADINYINCVPDPYFLMFYWLLPKSKTIFCAHDGEVNKVFDHSLIRQVVFNLAYKYVKYCCMFSASQAKLLSGKFPNVKVYIISLALKSFGQSKIIRSDETVNFLSFGVLNYSKNIDLLITAACNIYEQGLKGFKISIYGSCANWEYYSRLIRYPEIFDSNIRMIDNTEIPDVFSSAHYFVQPYRHVSQSGAMKVAFNYNIPIIASNLPGFSDEIISGSNGFLFTPGDSADLERVMTHALKSYKSDYDALSKRMAHHTSKNYSSLFLGDKYLEMFKEVIYLSRD